MAKAPFTQNAKGNVAVVVALAMPVVAAAGGAAIDFARLNSAASTLQDHADAAAIAATLKLADNPEFSEGEAQTYAAQHARGAFVATRSPHEGAVTATIQSATPARIKISLEQKQVMVFGGLFGMPDQTLTRSATAAVESGTPICLLILDPSSADALAAKGTSDLIGKKCAAQVNSSSPKALATNGNASIAMAKSFVVGPAQKAAGFTPTPLFSQKAVPDPFADAMPWPKSNTCAFTVLSSITKATLTLPPGLICGTLAVGNGGVVNLLPGAYFFDGDVELKSGGVLSAMNGTAVVLTGANSTINAQAGGSLRIRAPTTGPWANVALAVKPQAKELESNLIGGGDMALDGMVYMPTQRLHLTGGGDMEKAERPRSLIVNRLGLNGNGEIQLRSNSALAVNSKIVRLVK